MQMPESIGKSDLSGSAAGGLRIHESAREVPTLKQGPFAAREDGMILTCDARGAFLSSDGGATWVERPLFGEDDDAFLRTERALVVTRSGVAILACMNEKERHWTWDNERKDAPGATMPTYAMRSPDGGLTWGERRMLHEDWTGEIRNMIQTSDGRVVFSTMKFRSHPGRHTVMTYSSADDGLNWQASNVVDLGGCGHHGGVTEGAIVERKDGSLLMLIRTNWGQFWRALSTDGGRYWHPMGPSGISASSAPGSLTRLASGRIVLFWNRPFPEGQHEYPLRGGDCIWSATPVSNHRGELSVSFSADECETWTPPVVVAAKVEASLSYPYVFEVEPGMMWLTTMQGGVRLQVREDDLLEASRCR